MVRDTGSPPFVVDGNPSIGRESSDVKGPAAKAAGGPGTFAKRFLPIFGDIAGPAHNG